MLNDYDVIVVGAGFTGAIIAQRYSEIGKKVLVVDKRLHVGGDSYDYEDTNRRMIHRYGCHIFHTNDKEVMDYVSKYSEFYPYEHKVTALVGGKRIPIPVNLNSLSILGFNSLKVEELLRGEDKVFLSSLMYSQYDYLREIGEYLYNHVYSKYTRKQWGVSLEEVDPNTINRIPIYLDRDDRHFRDRYQCMPRSYTQLISNILSQENVRVSLGTDFLDLAIVSRDTMKVYDRKSGEEITSKIVYTGHIDYLFNHVYGELPYRSLNFVVEDGVELPTCGQNYSDSYDIIFTRSIDYSHLQESENLKPITISEYSNSYDKNAPESYPFYPVNNLESYERYDKYSRLASKFENLLIAGGQPSFQGLDMTTTIRRALDFEL